MRPRAAADSRSGAPAAHSRTCVSSRSFTRVLAEEPLDLGVAHLVKIVRHHDLAGHEARPPDLPANRRLECRNLDERPPRPWPPPRRGGRNGSSLRGCDRPRGRFKDEPGPINLYQPSMRSTLHPRGDLPHLPSSCVAPTPEPRHCEAATPPQQSMLPAASPAASRAGSPLRERNGSPAVLRHVGPRKHGRASSPLGIGPGAAASRPPPWRFARPRGTPPYPERPAIPPPKFAATCSERRGSRGHSN